MITEVLLVTLGAVKTPPLEIVPSLADQATAVLADPLILAVNCCCSCDIRVVVPGEIETVLLETGTETTMCAGLDPYIFARRFERFLSAIIREKEET